MGADLLFAIAPDLGADEYRKLIDDLDDRDVENIVDGLGGEGDVLPEARDWLKERVAELEGERRDTIRINLYEHDVIITAGMSWGDDPTDAWSAVCALAEVAALSAAQ